MASTELSCAGCRGLITSRRYLTCSICALVYDLECANVSETRFFGTLTGDKRSSWRCPGCISKQPKMGNVNTPVGASRSAGVRAPINPPQASPPQTPILRNILDTNQDDDSIILGSHLDQAPSGDGYVNAKSRRQPLSHDSTVANEISCVEDTICLDNIRAVMREEFQHILDERLTNLISKLVAEQVAVAVQSAIGGITNRLIALEGSVADRPSDSQRKQPENCLVDTVSTIKACSTKKLKSAKSATEVGDAERLKSCNRDQHELASKLVSRGNDANASRQALPTPVLTAPEQSRQDIPNNVLPNSVSADSEWIEMKRRRRSPVGVTRGTAAPGAMGLEACERWRYLHLYYVKLGTSVDQVLSHLSSVCCTDVCTAEALRARGRYASFKLGVPSKLADKIMLPENWPEDVCVKPWRQSFRAKNQKEQLS